MGSFPLHQKGCIPVKDRVKGDILKPLALTLCSYFLCLFSLSLSPCISPFIQLVKYVVQLYLILLAIITVKGLVLLKHCSC